MRNILGRWLKIVHPLSMNPHPLEINVVKFDGKHNFGIWRCEVMDALTTSNLEDTLRLKKARGDF